MLPIFPSAPPITILSGGTGGPGGGVDGKPVGNGVGELVGVTGVAVGVRGVTVGVTGVAVGGFVALGITCVGVTLGTLVGWLLAVTGGGGGRGMVALGLGVVLGRTGTSVVDGISVGIVVGTSVGNGSITIKGGNTNPSSGLGVR